MSNYQPGEGTTAARLIAALHEAGGSMTPARAAEVLGVPANNIGSSAKAAVKAGLVCYFAGGRGKSLWHLPGAGPNTTEAAAPAAAKRQKRKTRSAAPPPGCTAGSGRPGARRRCRDCGAVGRRRCGVGGHRDQRGRRERDPQRPAGSARAPLPRTRVRAHGLSLS